MTMLHLVELAAADYRIGHNAYCRAGVTTANGERIKLPPDCLPGMGFVLFEAHGSDLFIRFGDGTVEVDPTQESTVVSEEITVPGAKVPHIFIAKDTTVRIKLPAGVTHFAHVMKSGSGYLKFINATGRGGTDT